MNEEDTNVDLAQVSRNLHYVIDNGHGLKCRPAMVVEDWPDSGRPGYVNLVVFLDGSNDNKLGIDNHTHRLNDGSLDTRTDSANVPLLQRWETSVLPNHKTRAHRTWHWPRECAHMNPPAKPYVDKSGTINHHSHAEGFVDTNNCYACSIERLEKVGAEATDLYNKGST